jgi:hypothetical protein
MPVVRIQGRRDRPVRRDDIMSFFSFTEMTNENPENAIDPRTLLWFRLYTRGGGACLLHSILQAVGQKSIEVDENLPKLREALAHDAPQEFKDEIERKWITNTTLPHIVEKLGYSVILLQNDATNDVKGGEGVVVVNSAYLTQRSPHLVIIYNIAEQHYETAGATVDCKRVTTTFKRDGAVARGLIAQAGYVVDTTPATLGAEGQLNLPVCNSNAQCVLKPIDFHTDEELTEWLAKNEHNPAFQSFVAAAKKRLADRLDIKRDNIHAFVTAMITNAKSLFFKVGRRLQMDDNDILDTFKTNGICWLTSDIVYAILSTTLVDNGMKGRSRKDLIDAVKSRHVIKLDYDNDKGDSTHHIAIVPSFDGEQVWMIEYLPEQCFSLTEYETEDDLMKYIDALLRGEEEHFYGEKSGPRRFGFMSSQARKPATANTVKDFLASRPQIAYIINDDNGEIERLFLTDVLYGGKPFLRKPNRGYREYDVTEQMICARLMKNPQPNVVDIYAITPEYIDQQLVETGTCEGATEKVKNDLRLALTQLHSLDIVYMDFKPDNCGYDKESDRYKLYDFNASGIMTPNHLEWIRQVPKFGLFKSVDEICKKTKSEHIKLICNSPKLTRLDELIFYMTYGEDLAPAPAPAPVAAQAPLVRPLNYGRH